MEVANRLSLVNVASPDYSRNYILRERENGSNRYSPRGADKTPELKSSLEAEIHKLRAQMVKAAREEKSFTSEIVIRISMLLDEKINEYNAYMKKNKKRP